MDGTRHCRRWLPGGAVLLAMLTLQTLAPGIHAQADAPLGNLFETWTIWRDIELLNVCNEIGFTSEQAAQAVAAMAEAVGELDTIRAMEGSEELRTALRNVRAVLLKGEPIPEELWLEVARVRGAVGEEEDDEDAVERRKAELADEIGAALLGVLTPAQLSKLSVTGPERVAREIVENLAEARAKPPAEWEEFKADARDQLMDALEDTPLAEGNTLGDDLDAFFDRVRKMDTDTYFVQRDKLVEEFVNLLGSVQEEGPEAARMQALNRLAEWAEAPGLLQLLKDMAVANRTVVIPD